MKNEIEDDLKIDLNLTEIELKRLKKEFLINKLRKLEIIYKLKKISIINELLENQ